MSAPSCLAVSMAFFMIINPAPSLGALATIEDKVVIFNVNPLLLTTIIALVLQKQIGLWSDKGQRLRFWIQTNMYKCDY